MTILPANLVIGIPISPMLVCIPEIRLGISGAAGFCSMQTVLTSKLSEIVSTSDQRLRKL